MKLTKRKNLFHFELDYLSDLDIIGNYGVFNRERFADNEKGLEVNYQRIFDNFYIDIYGSFKNLDAYIIEFSSSIY